MVIILHETTKDFRIISDNYVFFLILHSEVGALKVSEHACISISVNYRSSFGSLSWAQSILELVTLSGVED